MNLPSKIKVLFSEVSVKRIPRDWPNDDAGQIDASRRVVRYRQISPMDDFHTLIHEILHKGWDMHGLGKQADEEAAVTMCANVMVATLVQNPELVSYLIAALGKEGH